MKNVLVVEDESDIASLLTIHLNDLGCSVTQVSSGDVRLKTGLQNSFNLIVLDVMLPKMDGLEI